ncbi:MAG: hypothetical protein IPP79_13445 [Chitinophagaceae bacterium]|nr:hypothetical protein [Chitinophagaceae bacterium]
MGSYSGSRQILNKAIIDLSGTTKSLHTDRIFRYWAGCSYPNEMDSIRRTGIIDVVCTVEGDEFQFE